MTALTLFAFLSFAATCRYCGVAMRTPQCKASITDLYTDLSPEETREAAERLREYIEVVIEIAREVESDPDKWKLFCELTGRDPGRTVDDDTIIEW